MDTPHKRPIPPFPEDTRQRKVKHRHDYKLPHFRGDVNDLPLVSEDEWHRLFTMPKTVDGLKACWDAGGHDWVTRLVKRWNRRTRSDEWRRSGWVLCRRCGRMW